MAAAKYSNPFLIHRSRNIGTVPFPDNEAKWRNAIKNTLFKNYFYKSIERGNCIEFADYDFTEISIDNLIVIENAKMLFINSYGEDVPFPSDKVFEKIVTETKEYLNKYRKMIRKPAC